jgi:hypothetical protein
MSALAGPAQAEEISRPITAWPILFHKADEHHAETDVLWPVYHFERNETWSKHSVGGILFTTQADPAKDFRKTSVLWPISTYERTGPKLWFHIFPLYWYKSEPGYRHNVIFPVYWDIERKDSSAFHVWPLFGVNRKGETFAEYSTIYPFFRSGRDSASGEVDVHFPWPLINYHHKGDYLSHRIIPLYWYEGSGETSQGFATLYFWKSSPDRTARGFFPLWYSSRAAEEKIDLVFPLYFNRETPGSRLRLITPFIVSRKTAGESMHLVFPLYYHSESPKTRTSMITPLFFTRRSGEGGFTMLLPVYFDYQTQNTGVTIGLPVYGGYRSGTFTFRTIFPVYYHSEDSALRSEFTYYFPLYGSYRRGETVSRHFVLFPLYSQLHDEELQLSAWDVLWPLFHYETSPDTLSVHALPLYWHSSAPGRSFTMGFPVYWSLSAGEENTRLVLPFYGVHRKGEWYRLSSFLGPLYLNLRDDHAGLSQQSALFWLYNRRIKGDEERAWFIPLYYHHRDADSLLTLWLAPPYVHMKRQDREWLHFWPFFGKVKNGTYTEYSTLWPLIRYGSDPEKDRSMVHVLLFYRARQGETSDTVFFPLWYHHGSPEKTRDASLFLHWYERDRTKDKTRLTFLWLVPGTDVALIRYRREGDEVRHAVFPLYTYSSNEKTDAMGLSFLWPLFSYEKKGESQSDTDVLWKVISYERKDAETSEFRFLWRFIRKSTTKTSSTFEFNPFFYTESEEGKGSYWAILGGLFGVETLPDQRKKVRLLWIF